MLVYVPAGRTEADDALGFYAGSQRWPPWIPLVFIKKKKKKSADLKARVKLWRVVSHNKVRFKTSFFPLNLCDLGEVARPPRRIYTTLRAERGIKNKDGGV